MGMEERLLSLIKERALRSGTFRLSSGKISPYYLDGKAITQDPEGLYLIANLIFSKIESLNVDAIGGIEIGAIPIACAVSYLSYEKGKALRAFIVRKAKKEHGTQKQIEGLLKKSDHVVIVDDVVTTGASIFQAIRAVEKEGAKIVKVIVLVDRVEGAREELEAKGYKFEALFTRYDLGISDEYLARFEGKTSGGSPSR